MPASKPAIKLSSERHAQITAMATAHNMSISEVMAKFVELAMNQGLIDHSIPGIKINALSDGVAIKFDDGETVGFSTKCARNLVDAIHDFLDDKAGTKKLIGANAKGVPVFSISKSGGYGFAVSIPAFAPRKVLDRGLAREFARLVDEAILETSAAA